MSAPALAPAPAPALPADGPRIDAAWLSQVLGRAVHEVAVTRTGLGEGFSGDTLWQVDLSAAPGAGPDRLIAKLAPAEPGAALAAANRREVGFYRRFGRHGLPLPALYFADVSPADGRSVILMQDLGRTPPGGFVRGLGAEAAGQVVRMLGEMQAAMAGDPALAGLSGGDILEDFEPGALWAAYPGALAALLPGTGLPPALAALGEMVVAEAPVLMAHLFERGPRTLLHRDLQIDNVRLTDTGPRFLDWQMAGRGRGVVDLAYFLASSLDVTTRRRHEAGLIAAYCTALSAGGGRQVAPADIAADYRIAIAWKLLVTVLATVTMDNSGAARRAWRRTDLARLAAFVEDHRITPARLGADLAAARD